MSVKTIFAHISDTELEEEYIRRNCVKFGEQIKSSEAAAKHFRSLFVREQHREHVAVIYLNSNNLTIQSEIQFSGSLSSSAVYPREIVIRALELSAAACIIGHNHPSGNLSPSNDDIEITKKVKQALKTIDIALLDHIIVGYGKAGFYSFADNQLL